MNAATGSGALDEPFRLPPYYQVKMGILALGMIGLGVFIAALPWVTRPKPGPGTTVLLGAFFVLCVAMALLIVQVLIRTRGFYQVSDLGISLIRDEQTLTLRWGDMTRLVDRPVGRRLDHTGSRRGRAPLDRRYSDADVPTLSALEAGVAGGTARSPL